MKNIEILFKELIFQINPEENIAFSGIGLLLYNNSNSLRQYHCNLAEGSGIPNLQMGSPELIQYLINISSLYHPCHDGFHFINQEGYLTHVAQFLSPPINRECVNIRGQGARTLCSLNGSLIKGVLMTAIISSKGDIYFFKNGHVLNRRSGVPSVRIREALMPCDPGLIDS